jgi:hypothetical protein
MIRSVAISIARVASKIAVDDLARAGFEARGNI